MSPQLGIVDQPEAPDVDPLGLPSEIIIGGYRSRHGLAVLAVFAPIVRLLDRLVPFVVWGGLAVSGAAILTGRAHTLGLSDTRAGYQPFHIVVIGLGVLVIAAVLADITRFGHRNKHLARERRRHPQRATGHSPRPLAREVEWPSR